MPAQRTATDVLEQALAEERAKEVDLREKLKMAKAKIYALTRTLKARRKP
jgi:hypothetical protein